MSDHFVMLPEKDLDSAPYWQHLQQHKACLQKCQNCHRFRFPPSPFCPYCEDSKSQWVPISGKGVIYSWFIVNHPIDPKLAKEVPFAVALVELDEGCRITGRLVNCDVNKIKINMRVKAIYDDVSSELTLMNFEPAI